MGVEGVCIIWRAMWLGIAMALYHIHWDRWRCTHSAETWRVGDVQM